MSSEGHIYRAAILFLFLSLLHDTNGSSIFSGNSTLRSKRQTCEFTCNDGQCISEDSICDGPTDCKDGSDETKQLCSTQTCPSFLFRCDYGACINKNKVCNKVKDCADNSDETTAGCNTKAACGQSEFRCKDGECISDFDICDGIPTCADGSDETEEACGSAKCPPFAYRCAYGACVNRDAKCNGKKDCADGSDEAGCPGVTPITPPTVRPTSTEPTTADSCLLPEHPANGRFSFKKTDTPYNPNTPANKLSTISLSCNAGYKTQGGENLFCIGGDWVGGDVSNQRCLKICPPLNDPTVEATCNVNNLIVSCADAVEGTQATTKCAPFFKDAHFRRPLMTCRNGDWTPYLGSCTPECGLKRVNAQTLVIGGSPAVVGEYPWVVAIYNASNVHICGGSIISRRYILSAAHCFAAGDGTPYDASGFTIVAGKHYRALDDPKDMSRKQVRKIAQLYVNEDYRGQLQNYQNDIAIAQMQEDFKLTTFVQPVCTSASDDVDLVENNNGVVSGWGFTEEGGVPAEELKKLVIPFQNKITCREHLPSDFYNRYFTTDKFCAGFVQKKTNVCSGDSGGGFYMNNTSGNFFVRGVVSLAPTSTVGCDSNNFALYTKVSKFDYWIYKITGGYI